MTRRFTFACLLLTLLPAAGLALETHYDDILPLLMVQDPDIETIGAVYSSAEASGVYGVERIKAIAGALGLTALEAGVNSLSDLSLTTESLIEKGAQALVVPADLVTVAGLPILMQAATENSIPVFHANSGAITEGATVAAGASRYDLQGQVLAATLGGYLSGSLDIARVGIGAVSDLVVGVDLDVAAQQELALAQELVDRADVVIEGGQVVMRFLETLMEQLGFDEETQRRDLEERSRLGVGAAQSEYSPELQQLIARQRSAQPDPSTALKAYFESVACTDETIARQQAELDATAG